MLKCTFYTQIEKLEFSNIVDSTFREANSKSKTVNSVKLYQRNLSIKNSHFSHLL